MELRGFEPLTYSMRTRTPGRLAAQAVTVVPESPGQSRWVCWLPEAAGNSAAGSLRAGAGTIGSQQTVCRTTSASPPASSWSCSGAVPPRPLVGPEHYRERCDS